MELSLDQLLASLQEGMSKSAEECEDKEEKKEEKSEGKGDGKPVPPWLKDKEEKSEDKEEKSEDKKEEKSEEGQEKSASEAGAALAREIMEKAAALKLEIQPEMKKEAQTAGKALGEALLANLQKSAAEKKANTGDITVMDGSPAPGTAADKVKVDQAANVAEGEAAIKPLPTGDGIKNTGTINEIFDAIVQDALAQGAASEEQVHDTGVANKEGNAESAVPNQVKVAEEQDAIEKAAAVSALVEQGVNFMDAVELVKQAAAEIEFEMEKSAAMQALIADGVDFDQAVELVKQASTGDLTVMDGSPAPGTAADKVKVDQAASVAEGEAAIKPMPTGDGIKNTGSINQIFDAIVQDALSQGAASTDQVHETGVASQEGNAESAVPNQVKVAAINQLVEAGVDFDEAVQFVKEASEKAKKDHMLKGWISPAWQENAIAADHGKEGLKGVGANVGAHMGGGYRAVGRGYLEGIGGAVGGGAIGAAGGALVGLASRGKINLGRAAGASSAVGTIAGAVGGYGHGFQKSLRNQAKEHHAKYAALENLVQSGVDFDQAVEMVKQASVAGTMTRLVRNTKVAVGRTSQAVAPAIKAIKDEASEAVRMGKLAINPASNKYSTNDALTRRGALQSLAGNRVVQGAGLAAGAAAIGGTAYAMRNREKKAAFDALVEAGVDFNQAAELVAAKSVELYGE